MDEATASVDGATDAFIQATVREAFRDTTIIEVAHRLETLMDADRILVLARGRVAEAGAPAALLARQGGALAALVDAAGPEGAARLRRLAGVPVR